MAKTLLIHYAHFLIIKGKTFVEGLGSFLFYIRIMSLNTSIQLDTMSYRIIS